ncbi:hypothetical protein B0H11DRAFT_2022085 [Mycena galericulata]|nr:hypothetical protein B0H11DRAFT_2022085 [Mycena galericulata]
MFSKSTCLALFTLAASTFSAQAVPLKQSFETETFCNTATIAISTVVHTQTVEVTKYITAANSQSTGSSSGKSSSGSSSSSSSNSSGSSSNSSGSSSKSSGSSSNSSGSSSKSSGSKGSSGDKGKGSKSSTTTTAAATTTSTAVNIDNSGGSSSSSGSGSDSGSDSDSGASAAAIALQTSLVLDPSVVCSGFANDGQSPPIAGQTASATTTNNFINFCALTLPGTPITNGQQITSGSCNPAPIGLIPSTSNMPSAKFTFPTNFATIASDTPFTITMALKNMQAGTFTDATKNYFAAPQTLNAQGQIIGHSHFVVESLTSIDQTTPNDPVKFVFFKGIDDAGVNGILSTPVAAGLPAGTYRVCSINSSSNHQPVIVPVAQHGALDDQPGSSPPPLVALLLQRAPPRATRLLRLLAAQTRRPRPRAPQTPPPSPPGPTRPFPPVPAPSGLRPFPPVPAPSGLHPLRPRPLSRPARLRRARADRRA